MIYGFKKYNYLEKLEYIDEARDVKWITTRLLTHK
jgi:hypothetical protein